VKKKKGLRSGLNNNDMVIICLSKDLHIMFAFTSLGFKQWVKIDANNNQYIESFYTKNKHGLANFCS
jgi:hypothetical protein